MPNRIIREGIIESESVNALSPGAEILYRRLMSKVDDYGRFHGSIELIRAACYPLQLDRVSPSNVREWLTDVCRLRTSADNGAQLPALVSEYEVNGKRYIQINNFGQRTRSESKFPPPSAGICPKLSADVRSRATNTSPSATPTPQAHTPPQAAAETAGRFTEWLLAWPRCAKPDDAARWWVSVVTSPEVEALAFGARDRYLNSDEVSRGVVMEPARFIQEQHASGWAGRWPPKRGPSGKQPQPKIDPSKIMLYDPSLKKENEVPE